MVELRLVVSMLLVFSFVAFTERCLVYTFGGWATPLSSGCVTNSVTISTNSRAGPDSYSYLRLMGGRG